MRTDPTWPTTWFVPRLDENKAPFKDVYSVMNNWGANHGAISYGHIGADLITLASMLRIPVCMHNVPEEQIFRPAGMHSAWTRKEPITEPVQLMDLFINKPNYERKKTVGT